MCTGLGTLFYRWWVSCEGFVSNKGCKIMEEVHYSTTGVCVCLFLHEALSPSAAPPRMEELEGEEEKLEVPLHKLDCLHFTRVKFSCVQH